MQVSSEWREPLNAARSPNDLDETGWDLKDEKLWKKYDTPEEIVQIVMYSYKKTK